MSGARSENIFDPHWKHLRLTKVKNIVTPNIEFDGSEANAAVAALIEQSVRKVVEALRCVHHFPGRVSIRVDGTSVRVVAACCPWFLQEVKETVGKALG